ncbi:MAG: BlaI/MecI/CopY family transcriptional regulator [Acidobacteriaceae bacterium]
MPTSAELRILRALWRLREGTVEEIVGAFPPKEQPNYKTTQTFLRIMEQKGFVRHTVRGRVFIFQPLISKEEVDGRSVQTLLQQNFGGSASGLLINLFESDAVASADLDGIEQLIRDYRKRKASDSSIE